MVLLKHSSTMDRVKDLLEVRLDVLHNEEDLLEAVKIDVLVFVQLLLDYRGRF
jgi:3-dehydroquinate dehydratase